MEVRGLSSAETAPGVGVRILHAYPTADFRLETLGTGLMNHFLGGTTWQCVCLLRFLF